MHKPHILVDGANIGFLDNPEKDTAHVKNLIDVKRRLESLGYSPIIIVDASFRYLVDDPDQLQGLFEKGKILQAPAGTESDYFLIRSAEEFDAYIVSNDRFEQYLENYPLIPKRRIPIMIIDGQIMFHKLRPPQEQYRSQ